jgi:hypothetical protein
MGVSPMVNPKENTGETARATRLFKRLNDETYAGGTAKKYPSV